MGKEEILVSVRPGAESHGINAQMIAGQLRAAFFGQRADQILVLYKGVIAERGRHTELLAKDGIYRRVIFVSSEAGTRGNAG